MTLNRGEIKNFEPYGAGLESFQHVRGLGQRGMWMVMHPHTGEHMDIVDFDIEIAARRDAGLDGVDFWSTPLPEVDNQ